MAERYSNLSNESCSDDSKNCSCRENKEMTGKWYNSDFFKEFGENIGAGFGLLSILGGIALLGYVLSYPDIKQQKINFELEKLRIEKGYVPANGDLNGKGIDEEFYVINGRKCVYNVDGKSIENYLKQK